MSLSQEVAKFIEKEHLFLQSDRLLLAVSGGVDSMVMLHLLHSQGFSVGVAHVNYRLRAEAADLDEQLVRDYCEAHDIPYHPYRVSDTEQSDMKQANLQEKARDIRRSWFKEIQAAHDYAYICTAHHEEDLVETMLLQLIRGTGLTGLVNLRASSDIYRRPFLATAKRKILQYAETYKVPYRDDESNNGTDYSRNFLRNSILPQIAERFPQGIDGLKRSAANLQQDTVLTQQLISKHQQRYVTMSDSIIAIGPVSDLRSQAHGAILLYHWLRPYGYNRSQAEQILETASDGAMFYTEGYEMTLRADQIWISPKDKTAPIHQEVFLGRYDLPHGQLEISITETAEQSSDPHVEYIPESGVELPFIVRTWQKGEKFRPIGMGGRSKNISDYYTHLKFSQFDKDRQLLLIDSRMDQIIWVISRRLDHRYRISSSDIGPFYRLSWSPDQR